VKKSANFCFRRNLLPKQIQPFLQFEPKFASDKSIKPAQPPGIKPPDPWKMVKAIKSSTICGDRWPQQSTEKQRHRAGGRKKCACLIGLACGV
jgi:hypothetical protein